MTADTPTTQAMIDRIVADLGGPMELTVDSVKVGDASQPVHGVVTTFMATVPVIKRAVEFGANVIITHEPTFFNHADDVSFMQNDPVYRAKRQLLEDSSIVVFRLHDYPHGLATPSRTAFPLTDPRTDPFCLGLVEMMGWHAYADPQNPIFCTIPPVALGDLVQQLKDRLRVTTVRGVGNTAQRCSRVVLFFGASGIVFHVPALDMFDADVVVTGECPEWETFAYAYDANQLGINRAVIAVGHQPSEEPGMERLTVWLRERFPDLVITHVPAENFVASY